MIIEAKLYGKKIITEWANDEVLTLVDYEVDEEECNEDE